ncbi:MAG: hypothetical protein K9L85_00255 [Candidatus Peribacteraceae bacterium]|nr:hypothetical protein [Candidatus Peribacteraceae bacterium]
MIFDRLIFAGHLQEDEKLLYVVHVHWFAAYRQLFKAAFFGMLIPAVFYAMFPVLAAAWVFGIWFLLGLIRFFRDVADWYFDAFLVTNLGVVDLDWRGIFDKSSTRISFDDLVSTAYDKSGFFSSIFNFGDIAIQTDGSVEINLENAVAPARAEMEILSAKEKYSHDRGLEDEKVLKEILSGMVKRHVRGEKEKGLADII